MYKTPNGKIVYQEDVQCVHDPVNGKGGIWIGNLQAAQNLQTLKKHGIKAVLTAAKGVFLNHSKTEIPYQLYIPGQDHQRFDISKFFNQSISFIRDALEKTNILVHCLAGVSRSVSLVFAYFIKYQNMGYDSVYAKIKSRRKIIHPNDGFISQLRKFETQCRQSGQVFQRNNAFENRSSYSPSKRYQRRDFEGYQPSPQKFYQSPQKRYTRNPDDFRYTDFDRNPRFNPSSATIGVRNPELYKSIAIQDTRKEKNFNYQNQSRQFSPDRYQRQNRTKLSLGIKRMSSMNVELDRPIQNLKRSQFLSNYQGFDQRNLISSDYKPLDQIQNRPSLDMNSEIDRKIAQIRKKYQQYTKIGTVPEHRQIQRKYSNNVSTVQQSNENFNLDDLMDLKMKKISTDFEINRNDIYSGASMVRNNNYINEQAGSKFVGSRLRRLQSYQC